LIAFEAVFGYFESGSNFKLLEEDLWNSKFWSSYKQFFFEDFGFEVTLEMFLCKRLAGFYGSNWSIVIW
jgi:hypothetical protein